MSMIQESNLRQTLPEPDVLTPPRVNYWDIHFFYPISILSTWSGFWKLFLEVVMI